MLSQKFLTCRQSRMSWAGRWMRMASRSSTVVSAFSSGLMKKDMVERPTLALCGRNLGLFVFRCCWHGLLVSLLNVLRPSKG